MTGAVRYVSLAVFAATTLVSASAGFAEMRSFELPPFDEIEVATGIRAEISIGTGQVVRVEADDPADFDDLVARVRNGRLELKLERGFPWRPRDWFPRRREVSAVIVVPEVHEIGASSGAEVTALGIAGDDLEFETSSGASLEATGIDGEEILAEASSGASVVMSGICGELDAEVSSGARIMADALTCRRVTVEASSGASAIVNASEAVAASASSGGRIDVRGAPADTELDMSSGGTVDVGD